MAGSTVRAHSNQAGIPAVSFTFMSIADLLHTQPAGADAGPVRAHDFRKSKPPYKKKPVRIHQYS